MKPSFTFPNSFAEVETEIKRLQSLPDDSRKLGKIHALGVYCRSHPNFSFGMIFQSQLGPDLIRLEAFWGTKNGMELLAEQIARNGGGL